VLQSCRNGISGICGISGRSCTYARKSNSLVPPSRRPAVPPSRRPAVPPFRPSALPPYLPPMRAISIAAIVILLVTGCSGDEISPRQLFLAQSSVSVQFENWVRAINNKTMDSLAVLYHQVPELRVIDTDGSIARGWEEQRERLTTFLDSVVRLNFVAEGLEIEVLNKELVLTTFRHSLDSEGADGERTSTLSGRGTMVWIKDEADGVWKIHMQHLSGR